MPGFVYVFGLMTAGLLSMLLLALRAEKSCGRAVEEALAKLPALAASDRLFAGRRGLAIDRRQRALCFICAEGEIVRLHVVPFSALRACELQVGGHPIARTDWSGARLLHPDGLADGDGDVRLRLQVADHYAPSHELPMDDLAVGLRWQAQLGLLIPRAAPPAPAQGAPAAAPAVPVSPALRAALRRYLTRELAGKRRLVVSERKLRDGCAPGVPLIRFHEQMNRLRRAKALDEYCLSYARNGEVWRISRREGRRAA